MKTFFFFGDYLRLCPWPLTLASSIPSSVAGEGGGGGVIAHPIGLKNMICFLFWGRFVFKNQKQPPHWDWGREFVKDLMWFWLEFDIVTTWIWTKTLTQIQWKPFSFFFFLRSPEFDRKTASIRFKTDQNLGQSCLLLFLASNKASPIANSWLRAWAFLSLASRVSVLGRAVLGLGLRFFLCP